MLSCFSCVLLFAALWTLAHQVSLPWDSAGKNTGMGCHALLQGIFPTQGLNPCLLHCRKTLFTLEPPAKAIASLFVCVLSHFSRVQPCAALWTVAHQALLSMGFSRQEHWSGLPFPSPGDLPGQKFISHSQDAGRFSTGLGHFLIHR